MEFKDFKDTPKDLIGRKVLYERGMAYYKNTAKSVLEIVKVTKTGFRISSNPDILFSLDSGRQKGLNGRWDMGRISKCTLLSDKEADLLIYNKEQDRKCRVLRLTISAKTETMTYEQLKQIELIINKMEL